MEVSKLPDVIAMLKIETQISTFSNQPAIKVLPLVRENLRDINRAISNANNVIRAKVVIGVVVINNQLSEREAQDELKASEWEEELVRLRKKLAAALKEAEAAIKAVAACAGPDIAQRQADLQRDREKQCLALALITESTAQQSLKLVELNEAIGVLERPSLRKVFKSLIPTADDVDAIVDTLKLATLDVAQVKAAIEKVNTNLEWLAEGRRFADLVAAREKLQVRIGELQASVSQATGLLESTDEEITHYSRVADTNGLREQWLQEAGTFQHHWHTRQARMAGLSQASALTAALKDLLDYLIAVRRQFEAH